MYFLFIHSSYFDDHYEITLEENQLSLQSRFHMTVFDKRVVSPETLQLFWEKIKSIHLETWNNEYFDMNVLDGLQWKVEVKSDFLTKKIEGSNAFPDGGIELEKTPIFDELLKAVEFLLGEEDFFN